MDIIQALESQIVAAKILISKIYNLERFVSPRKTGIIKSGLPSYNKDQIHDIEDLLDNWQYKTRGILSVCFGDNSENKYLFERTIIEHRVYFDAKTDLEKEVKNGMNALSSIIESERLNSQLQLNTTLKNSTQMSEKKPLVFISHSGKQKVFVTALVELLEKCGFNQDKLFCSSVPGFDIGFDEDIVETLKKKFLNYNLYIIYVLSPDYYESAYCLNEMGAAWLIQADYTILVIPGMDQSKIDGVISKTKLRISFDVIDTNLKVRITDLRKKLIKFVGLPDVKDSNWERYYESFVNQLKGINHKKNSISIDESNTNFKSVRVINPIVMSAIQKLKVFTMNDIQVETGLNRETIRIQLRMLVENGILSRDGNNRSEKYSLNN